MNSKSIIILCICIFGVLLCNSQTSPCTTTDFNLLGYPKSVRYMKFESDSSLKKQRISYIEDYQLNFDDNRLLTERINFINGNRDRTTKYEYNVRRQLIKETISEENGNIVSIIEYTYNNIGRLATLKETSYPNSRGGANRTERIEVYTYSNKGLLIEKDISSDNKYGNKNIKYYYGPSDSLISTTTTYGYNSNIEKLTIKRAFNNLAMEKTWTRNKKQTRRETYEYNDDGLISSKEVYSADNKKLLTYTYQYDEHYNIISEIAIDSRRVKSIEYTYDLQKDKYFNWTKRTMYDSWAVKYTEIRSIEYFDKTHFYDDLKDYDTKRVLYDKIEQPTNKSKEYKDKPVNQ